MTRLCKEDFSTWNLLSVWGKCSGHAKVDKWRHGQNKRDGGSSLRKYFGVYSTIFSWNITCHCNRQDSKSWCNQQDCLGGSSCNTRSTGPKKHQSETCNCGSQLKVGSVDHNCLRPRQWTRFNCVGIECVSVRKKLFSEHHGRFSPGRCPQPQRQPQHLQRDDLPGEHIARDRRSHPSRFSFLEQKVFSVLKKICVSRRRLRRQWEWTGRAWLPSSYSTSQCSW